jgi:hypothetical protein
MTYKHIERPYYLIGTFDWRGLGYNFNNKFPQELLNLPLNKDDPWNCIGQFLAHCKNGEFQDTKFLQEIIMDDNVNEPLILQSCYDLLGDVASKNEIIFLESLITKGSKNQKLSASWAAQWTASLELMEALLITYKSFSRKADKDAISVVISNVLESEDESELYDYDGDDESYGELVMKRKVDLEKRWPGYTRFYSGIPLDIIALTTRFRQIVFDMVNKDKVPQESLIILRRWFESSTGTDCSFMFINKRFNPQAALDILDNWLDTNTIEYAKGVKYFLGRPCGGYGRTSVKL